MEWIMVVLFFLPTNLFTVLLCRFTFQSQMKPKEGMILGIHIPKEHQQDEEVLSILREEDARQKRFFKVHTWISVLVCLAGYFGMAPFMLIWFPWLMWFVGRMEMMSIVPIRRMYRLKMENGWIREEAQRVVPIDTVLSASPIRPACRAIWHLPILGIFLLSGYGFYRMGFAFSEYETEWILYGMTCLIELCFTGMHIWILKRTKVVYSRNSSINLAIAKLTESRWAFAMMLGSCLNLISWLYLYHGLWKNRWLYQQTLFTYLILQLAAAAAIVIPLFLLQKKKQELLKGDQEPFLVDDDEYWKNGWYSNPDDHRLFVPYRLNSASYSLNMAKKSAKVLMTLLVGGLAGCMVWVMVMMVQLTFAKTDFEISNGTVYLESAGYHTSFALDEVEELLLLESLPDDSFSKTNGAASDVQLIGHFKGREYGKCMMFLDLESNGIIGVRTDGRWVFFNASKNEETLAWYQTLENVLK